MAVHLLGSAADRSGRNEAAHRLFLAATILDPGCADGPFDLGRVRLAAGRHQDAVAPLRRALALSPDYPLAHLHLAMATLPGETYLEVLRRAHVVLRPDLYLEIGVGRGTSLVLARPPTRAIGVDPNPRPRHAFEATTTLHRMTSDAFFATVADDAVGRMPIAMAFIDGMHTFDQALRDFANVERHAAANAVVFIHDCIPLDAATSTRTRNTAYWSGDTWKIVPALKRYRPDLAIRTIAAGPSGLAVVTGLDAGSRVIDERWPEIVAAVMPIGFDTLDRDRVGMLNIVPNDGPAIESMLREAQGRPART